MFKVGDVVVTIPGIRYMGYEHKLITYKILAITKHGEIRWSLANHPDFREGDTDATRLAIFTKLFELYNPSLENE